MLTLEIVRFCAQECFFQKSGEESVSWMCDAWMWAQQNSDRLPTVDDVLMIARLVEPVKNAKGFRKVPIRIGWETLNNQQTIPTEIVNLMEAIPRLAPAEWFHAFELTHPLIEGNGRTGNIIFQWLSGTLENPVWPPDFFGCQGRVPGFGASLYSGGLDD